MYVEAMKTGCSSAWRTGGGGSFRPTVALPRPRSGRWSLAATRFTSASSSRSTGLRRPGRRALAAWALLFTTTGCWSLDSDTPPAPSQATCNNNGVCEADRGEECATCSSDCPCCSASQVFAADGVQNENEAQGDADGKFAELGATGVIHLEAGSEIVNGTGSETTNL